MWCIVTYLVDVVLLGALLRPVAVRQLVPILSQPAHHPRYILLPAVHMVLTTQLQYLHNSLTFRMFNFQL
jgi:hypothetical protein